MLSEKFIENFTIPDFSDEDVREMRCLSDEKSITEKLSQKYQIKCLYQTYPYEFLIKLTNNSNIKNNLTPPKDARRRGGRKKST
jgi:hypothetical protein